MTPVVDEGPIIAQGIVPVYHDDDVQALAARLLPLEHKVYNQVV